MSIIVDNNTPIFTGLSSISTSNVIFSGGNVGIGTTTPASKLDVVSGSTGQVLTLRGAGTAFGIASGVVAGANALELTTADVGGLQATRLLFRGGIDAADVEFYRGARTLETISMHIEGDNGNVGIGTSSPTATLSLGTSIATDKLFLYDGPGTYPAGDKYGFGIATGILQMYSPTTSSRIAFGTRNSTTGAFSENVSLSSAGNVGIGTTTPVGLLNLRGYTGGTAGSLLSAHTKTLEIGGVYNQSYNTGNSVLLHIGDYSNDSGDDVYPIYMEDENNIVDFYINAGNTQTAATKRAYFGGSVGIGTSPSYKLDVTSTDTIGIRYIKTATRDARIQLGDPTKTWSFASGWATAGDFSIIEEGVQGNSLYIKQGGNVGISTSSPTQKLEVSGTGYATSDFRAPIFYDSANTAYYLDPANTGTSLNVAGTSIIAGNVAIGYASTTRKLDVNGVTKTLGFLNTNDCFEKIFPSVTAFTNATANLAVDVRLGNLSFWGYIEVEVTSTYNYQNSSGKLTKIFAVGTGVSNLIYTNESRISDAMGTIPDNFAIGDFAWDAVNTTYKIPISHIVSSGNTISIRVKMFTNGGGSEAVMDAITVSPVYTLTALARQWVYYNNNIGIGKVTPLTRLDVLGEFRVSNATGVGGDYDNYCVRINAYYSGDALKIYGNSNNEYFGVYNYNKTALGLVGNVGIGTSTPGQKLEVAGIAYATSDFRAPIFYDSADTTYYIDPASTANTALKVRGGAIFGPNTTWSASLYVGTNGNVSGTATVAATDGNIHIDTAGSGYPLYLQYYNGGYTLAYGSMRSPIFYDLDNTAYYGDFNSTGVSVNIAGTVNAATYNKPGLTVNASGTSSSGGAIAIQQMTGEGWTGIFCDFEPYTGWGMWHDNPSNYILITAESSTNNIASNTVPSRVSGNRTAYTKFQFQQSDAVGIAGGSWRAPIFYDYNNTAYYIDPAATSSTAFRTIGDWRSDATGWTGEFSGKMQYHANHWYIQAADLFIYRNSGGTNVFTINQSGTVSANTDFRAPIFYDSNDTNYYCDPNGTTRLNIVNFIGDVTLNAGATSSNLYFADSDEGTRRMHCNSNRIGFLSDGNAWGSYCGDGGEWYSDQSIRTPIFYDNNDTTYYGDFNSDSNWQGLTVRGKAQTGLTGQSNYKRPNITGDSNYWNGSMGWGTENFDTVFTWGTGFFDTWSNPANQPAGTSHWNGYNAGHHVSHGYQMTMGAGDPALTYLRGKWGGWTAWYKVAIYENNSNAARAFYASIYYDSNNTGYYGDFASTSKFNTVQIDYINQNVNFQGQIIYDVNQIHASILYHRNNTGYYVQPASTSNISTLYINNGWTYVANNYGYGVVGLYASTIFQLVFAMGDSYKTGAGGNISNLYGMAWSYPSAGGIAGNLDSHGMIVAINGGFGSCMSYSIVAAGNVTAYSDERLKTNWSAMPENFVERLAKVRTGTYNRIDGNKLRQVGVSAQSLRPLLPEAVIEATDDFRTLSVSYGNAAMASAVELAKEVVSLKEQMVVLMDRLNKLENK